MIKNNKKLCWW